MIILGIETSCDETSVALLEAQPKRLVLRKHAVSSQVALHRKYGGVVPELAARKHIETLQPMIESLIGRKRLASIDMVAVTNGPGLVTSLTVGVQTARTLSYAFRKPLIGVNHLEAHVYANWLTHTELVTNVARYLPAVTLIVSGGHTEFLVMHGHGKYELLGSTRDDAAGESFDKVAQLLKLGYPGGPAIGRCAVRGNPDAIPFPRPMAMKQGYEVSFSGLKTAVLYYLERKKTISKGEVPDIAASFQLAVVDTLMAKVRRACASFSPRSLILAGGVSANTSLREAFTRLAVERSIPVFVPALEYTGDNAAMVAVAGYYRRRHASHSAWRTIRCDAHLRIV